MGQRLTNIKLYNIKEVPSFQRFNPYILRGYRAYLTVKQCLVSLIVLSNEFFNIWSHVAALVLWVYLSVNDHFVWIPKYQGVFGDHLAFGIFHLGCQACMLLSAMYHTFNAHKEEKVVCNYLSADIAGICVAILGCFIVGIYTAFYCHTNLLYSYMTSCCSVIGGSMVVMMQPSYNSEENSTYRSLHFILLVFMGIIPLLHWCSILTPSESTIVLPGILNFYLLLGVAFSFYITCFPERCFPGYFDFIGQSHNLWHVMIALALLYWRSFHIRMLEYRYEAKCQL